MHFSRVRILPGANLLRFLGEIKKRGVYGSHQFLWNLFPDDPDAKRDFLFREVKEENFPTFYLVSGRLPEEKEGIEVRSKPYQPRLAKGQLFRFDLRANPTVVQKDAHGKSLRHDVIMAAKKTAKANGKAPPVLEEELDTAKNWLLARASKHGFELETNAFVAESYLQHRIQKDANPKPIRFSTVDFRGILQVVDPGEFARVLNHGIGRCKAFGCGLVLLRKFEDEN